MNSPIVLCIDDRPQLLNLRKAALESQGYCVKTVSSGYSALQMLHEMSADVVLLEFKMESLDALNIDSFLAAVHARRKIIHFRRNQTIFSQGEGSDAIFYIEKGSVKLTITSEEGREAIVGVFGGGDFFGESCIASGRPVRFHTAIAITDTRVVKIGRDAIINALRTSSDALYAFVSSMLRRDARIQQDLASYILETGEKRLARALLTIARLNENHTPPFAKFSQQDWADMIGLTRQRINALLKGFRKSGFISDARGFKVNPSILTVLQKGTRPKTVG